jgi:membrane protease YdiL (CAAX protease family)
LTLEDFRQYVPYAGLVLWAAGALFFVIRLGVFSPAALRAAPTRESSLSLPVIGAVLILYYLMQAVTVSAGSGLGWITQADFAPARRPAASQPASGPATSASAPQTGTAPAAASTSAPAPVVPSARMIVLSNAVGGVARALTVAVVILLIPRLFKNRFAGWGIHIRQAPGGILKGLLGFSLMYPFLMAFGIGLFFLYSLFTYRMSEHPTFEALQQRLPLAQEILLCGVAIVVAPIAEEVFFRGIVQTTLIQFSWGLLIPQLMRPAAAYSIPRDYRPSPLHRWGAIVITSAAFASLHQWDQAPIIFVLSLVLGYVYERTGNLWAPIVLHVAFNSTQITQYFSGI